MSLSTDLNPENDTVTISIAGRFDFSRHKDFRDSYKQYPEGRYRYVLDLSKTEYIDSSALGMLLLLREYAGGEGSHISIQNPHQDVKDILEVSNFNKLFDIT